MVSSLTYKIDKFKGLNTQILEGSIGEVGQATTLSNFRIRSDGRLAKRDGYKILYYSTIQDSYMGQCVGSLVNDNVEKVYYIIGRYLLSIIPNRSAETIIKTFSSAPPTGLIFIWNRNLYAMTTKGYEIFDGLTWSTREAYCPKITINAFPWGVGTPFEDINLLSPFRSAEYISSSEYKTYKLPENNLTSIRKLEINDTLQDPSGYTVNLILGTFTLPALPKAGYKIYVEWEKQSPENLTLVTSFSKHMFFGGANDSSLFIWGGYKYKSMRLFSAPGNPEYFPACNTSNIGSATSPITNIVRHYDRQLIFTDNEIFYSVLDMSNPLNISYPVFSLNSEIGCQYPNTVRIINNNPVFLSNGMAYELISTNVRDERNVRPIGSRVATLLKKLVKDYTFTYDNQDDGELYICSSGTNIVYNYKVDAWYEFTGLYPRFFFKLDNELYFLSTSVACFKKTKGVYYDFDRGNMVRNYVCNMTLSPLDFNNRNMNKRAAILYIKAAKYTDFKLELSTNSCNNIPFCDISTNYINNFSPRKFKILSGSFNYLTLSISSTNNSDDTNISDIYFTATITGK